MLHFDGVRLGQTLQTKNDDLVCIMRLKGLPYETEDIDYILHRKTAFNTAIKSVNTGNFCFWSFIIRGHHHQLPQGEFTNFFVKALSDGWHSQYKNKDMFTNEY